MVLCSFDNHVRSPSKSMSQLSRTNNLQVFSWGANSHGQLGQGDELDRNQPNACKNVFSTNVKYLTGGGSHTAFLDEHGCLHTCGLNKHGQTGFATSETNNTFNLLSELRPYIVKEVACGWDFTLALLDLGSVFSWGSNAYCQLGIEESLPDSPKPLKIKTLVGKNIIKIAAGLRHGVAISEESIWAWGENRKSQCDARINNKIIKTPIKIDLPVGKIKFKSIKCGSFHTVVISTSSDVYGWGSNNKGQLTVDPLTNKSLAPLKLSVPRLSQVSCGWTHNIGLIEEGIVVSWGRGDYGQLGRPCPISGYDFVAKIVEIKGHITKVCCGSEHCLALTEKRKLYSWGWNEHGMCGQGHEKNVLSPTEMPYFQNKNVLEIGSGAGHSICLSHN